MGTASTQMISRDFAVAELMKRLPKMTNEQLEAVFSAAFPSEMNDIRVTSGEGCDEENFTLYE